MNPQHNTAIVLGATGLTGGILLSKLLDDPTYHKVKIFSRSPSGVNHPKLEEYLGNLLELTDFRTWFRADVAFCCIGTTKAKTPDREKYRAIDFGIPVEAAKLCRENGIGTYVVISSLGADPDSGIFYNRLKGEMEDAVLAEGLSRTYILQPSIIGGNREENRPGEWIAKKLFAVLNIFLLGPLKKYRSISPSDIASAMIWLAGNDYPQVRIESDQIKSLAHA